MRPQRSIFLLSLTAACALLATGAATTGCSSDGSSQGDCVDNGSEALKVCSKGTVLAGIDVSVYQGTVNWGSVKAAGKVYAFARVSDGLNSPDSKFATNWPAMKKAGVLRGTYQFFRPSQDPNAQAKLFMDKIKAAGGMQPGDLPPVLDLESADGQSPATVQARAKTWLDAVEKGLGIKPLVYTAAFMSPSIGTAFKSYTLWVANYGATCPTVPDGWANWKFWQSADNGKVTGISGAVDLDQFQGTMADLTALTLKAPAKPDGGTPPKEEPAGDGGVEPSSNDDPSDGDPGATLGSGNPEKSPSTTGAPLQPCQ